VNGPRGEAKSCGLVCVLGAARVRQGAAGCVLGAVTGRVRIEPI
jgi:hypothetical protein